MMFTWSGTILPTLLALRSWIFAGNLEQTYNIYHNNCFQCAYLTAVYYYYQLCVSLSNFLMNDHFQIFTSNGSDYVHVVLPSFYNCKLLLLHTP
jgi:hypothetical protein